MSREREKGGSSRTLTCGSGREMCSQLRPREAFADSGTGPTFHRSHSRIAILPACVRCKHIMALSYKCTFKFLPSFKKPNTNVVQIDIERSIAKCIFNKITNLIDECVLMEDAEAFAADSDDVLKELIKNIIKCTDCQSLQKNYFAKYYAPLARDSTAEPVFETRIKYRHRRLRYRATISWKLVKCSRQ